ncbi:MAG: calcium/sodium antiporter [Clostridiales bacterium]
MKYLFLAIGFVLLIKGADYFIGGSSAVAARLRIPGVIVGLTIVAMGTSAPELSVSIVGALQGQSGISVGNIIGSNIFNVLCVGGIAALIMPLKVNDVLLKRDIPISLLAVLLFLFFAWNGKISQMEGFCFLILFVVFLFFLFMDAIKSRKATKKSINIEENEKIAPITKNLIYIVGGLSAVVLGGETVVRSATAIAQDFGLSQSLIGLTVVALGTSLPELITTLVAAKKGETDIALGNIIGSNIFNIALVLGTASAITPLFVENFVLIDCFFLGLITLLLMVFSAKYKKLKPWHGGVLVLLYIVYLVYIIMRG